MKTTVYLSRKLLNQLKVKEAESTNLLLTHNLHNITVNGKRVGCSGHIVACLGITKNDAETIVCWKSSMMPLILTLAPAIRQKAKNSLMAE